MDHGDDLHADREVDEVLHKGEENTDFSTNLARFYGDEQLKSLRTA